MSLKFVLQAKLLYLGELLTTDKDRDSSRVLRQKVKEAGLENDVIFLGYRKDVPFYLSLMDVVVHPSHHEGFPRIPVEAGAMTRPSVCSSTPGAEVAIDDGKTGFIVPIKDPLRLSLAISQILRNPVLASEMGARARLRVIQLFDQSKIVDQQVRVYEELIRRKGTAKFLSV